MENCKNNLKNIKDKFDYAKNYRYNIIKDLASDA